MADALGTLLGFAHGLRKIAVNEIDVELARERFEFTRNALGSCEVPPLYGATQLRGQLPDAAEVR